ncbi:MAG: glycosyltransferase family 2 protein [Bacteroidetes bacterium]|nr:glycosyltransferase family 2 protein [Bacteroidota bacterium]
MELKTHISSLLHKTRKYLSDGSLLISIRLVRNRLLGIKPDKRAFLVLGAESHGSHLVTDILINAGCVGHAGNHVPWQPDNKVLLRGLKKPWQYEFPTDLQPWDRKLPTNEDPIVWRRSLPYGKEWTNLTKMIRSLQGRAYVVKVVVVTRDTYSGLQSQLKWQHVEDIEKGKSNITQAYLHIFRHLLKSGVAYTMVNYEALAHYPKAQDFLLEQLELELPERRWPVYDGNKKWHNKKPKEALADFPEGWYPCQTSNQQVYFKRVREGYKKMSKHTTIFCGLARDVIESLPIMMAKIEKLGQKFKDYKVVIYENDSMDGSREMLMYWQRINPNVEIISEQLNARKWGQVLDMDRTADMSEYRNRYLRHILEKKYKFDYLIVLDLDIPLGFSYDGIAHTFSYDEWDVMGSNGRWVNPYGDPIPNPLFYDAFAFRPKGEPELQDFETINSLQFQRGEDLVPVESSFGGLAIYKSAGILAGARYGGHDCEHVVLHHRLRENGFDKQFLNPSQIVLSSYNS